MIYSKRQISEMIYRSELESMPIHIINKCVNDCLKMTEQSFIEEVNKVMPFKIEPVIKNRYFII